MALWASQAANTVLPWITFPYLTRVLGPEHWGLIGWSREFMRYFTIVTLYGFDLSATRQVALNRDDPEKLSRIYSAVMYARILLAAGCLVVVLTTVLLTPTMRPHLLLFMIVFIDVVAYAAFPQWLFQGIEKMGVVSAREVGARLIGLLPTFLLVRSSGDYQYAALVQTGSWALAAFAGLALKGRYCSARFVKVSWADIFEQYRQGWPVFLSIAAIYFYGTTDRFILRFLAGDKAVGLLAVAQRIVDAADGVVLAVSMALFPHISNLAEKRRGEAVAVLERAIRLAAIPSGLITAGILLLAPYGVHLLSGTQYAESVPLLRILSPFPLILAFGSIYATQFMLGLGYKNEWTRLVLETAAVNFVFLIVLLQVLEPARAVAATTTLAELWLAVRAWQFYRKRRFDGAVT